jgi:hypothetical protein
MKVKKMKVKTDIKGGKGLGDCVADIAHALGLDEMAKKYEQTSGKPCGCRERQEILNKVIPDVPFTS